jgi:hypothetical protein
MGRAGRQEKLRPQEKCFFLDSFYGTYRDLLAVERLTPKQGTAAN